MAQKGLFFNAFPDSSYETGYDRNYSADDISNWLKVVITTGVIKTNGSGQNPQGLKVVAASGLNIQVNVGMACINGKPYINDSLASVTLSTAPTGSTPRYDCIVLRLDNSQTLNGRKTSIGIVSLNAVPTVEDLERTDEIYDLLLGYVVVQPNATTIEQTDIVDTRGDDELCPWCTAVKGYEDYYDAIIQEFESNITLNESSSVVITDLPSNLYNNRYSLIDVYVNGLKEENTNYSIDATNQYIKITFTSSKNAGAEISVVLNNFIDGEGLSNVLDEYNQFVQDVADLKTLKEFNYYCNGSNDNVEITNIVNDFLASSGAYYKTLKLNIIGVFGMTAPVSGDGTSASPYNIFAFNSGSGNRRFILDFTRCNNTVMTIPNNSYTYIFNGENCYIKGASIVADNSTSIIVGFGNHARIRCEDCRFWLNGANNTMVASRGTFVNCQAEVKNAAGVSYCFYPTQNTVLLVIKGGEYRAYTGDRSSRSAVVGLQYNSAVVMIGVNAPTSNRSALYQTHAIYHYNLGTLTCVGLITTLTVTTAAGSNVYGTIPLSLYNHVW